jgi:hypothetical protein
MTTPWRDHPKLRGRFGTEHPDDLQVIVHDGGPRLTDHAPELLWVTVTGCEGDVFSGRVLNQPEQVTTVAQGDEIRFVVPDSGEHALLVTKKYLQERPDWIIQPCQKCGLSELFDAPSDLMRVVFPDAPAIMEAFTAFCGACGGVQVVQYIDADIEDDLGVDPTSDPKKWWQFWR